MREEDETKEWGGEPSCAGLVFGNEESTSLFSLGETEVLKGEPIVMPLEVQDGEMIPKVGS